MTAQHVTFVTGHETTTTKPTLLANPLDPTTAPLTILPVPRAEIDAIEIALSGQGSDFDAPPSQVLDALIELARNCLPPAAANTVSFRSWGSRPVQDKWTPTSQIWLNPVDGSVAICVASETASGVTSWTQLKLHAVLSPIQIP